MIIFFGPAGAGKSLQGQIMAARHGWRWLSAGQLLRDTHDPKLLQQMAEGELVDDTAANGVVQKAIEGAKDITHLILDGYPRHFAQVEWLEKILPQHQRAIQLIVVLDLPENEVIKRLHLRGRADDTPQAIKERLALYQHEMRPVIDYFAKQGVRVAHVDGTGTVGEVHDRIEAELKACSLV